MGNGLDDIEALKANRKAKELTNEQEKKLREDVKKIIIKREKKEKEIRRAEMEHFYELNMYA